MRARGQAGERDPEPGSERGSWGAKGPQGHPGLAWPQAGPPGSAQWLHSPWCRGRKRGAGWGAVGGQGRSGRGIEGPWGRESCQPEAMAEARGGDPRWGDPSIRASALCTLLGQAVSLDLSAATRDHSPHWRGARTCRLQACTPVPTRTTEAPPLGPALSIPTTGGLRGAANPREGCKRSCHRFTPHARNGGASQQSWGKAFDSRSSGRPMFLGPCLLSLHWGFKWTFPSSPWRHSKIHWHK